MLLFPLDTCPISYVWSCHIEDEWLQTILQFPEHLECDSPILHLGKCTLDQIEDCTELILVHSKYHQRSRDILISEHSLHADQEHGHQDNYTPQHTCVKIFRFCLL